MWANVWFVIWPNNKIVIQNAIDTGAGKPANPAAAPAGARGGLASRTNVVMSIPMLLFMGSASHMPFPKPMSGALFWIVALVIIALVEANALYGTPGQGRGQATGHGQGHALGGLHPHGCLLRLVRRSWEPEAGGRFLEDARTIRAGVGSPARVAFGEARFGRAGLALRGPGAARRSSPAESSDPGALGRVIHHEEDTAHPETRAGPPRETRSARSGRPRACPVPDRSGPPRIPPGSRTPCPPASRRAGPGRCPESGRGSA